VELFAAVGWVLAIGAGLWAWRLRDTLVAAEAERAALVTRTQAALHEAEATVRRIRDEGERARPFAAEPVLRDVLELVDNLDRALAAGEGGTGVVMIHRQSLDLLRRHGAERVSCLDQPFDPLHHEAVATAPAPGVPHRVLAEISAGYRLHSRLLRAARVVVAVPIEEPEETVSEHRYAADADETVSEALPEAGVGEVAVFEEAALEEAVFGDTVAPPAPSDLTLRPATLADAAALADLKRDTFRETFLTGGFDIPYPPDDLAAFERDTYTPEAVAAELADTEKATWVAERAGRLLAYAHVGPSKLPHPDVRPGDAELYQLYVRRDAQGARLGAELMALALAHLAAHRPGPVWLGVWSGNLKAQAFYAARGFVKVGDYRFPVGSWYDDEYILRRG